MWAILITVLPHVGGVETPVNFTAPDGVGIVADGSFTVTWADNNDDPTGIFSFYFQPVNKLPFQVSADELSGQPVPGGEMVMAVDPANALVWDTSAVPSGSYYLYGVTTDPPLPQLLNFSSGVVTVQHPGDPLYPAVYVPEPDGVGDIVADEYTLVWSASGQAPITATIRYGDLFQPMAPLVQLAADVPMTAAGDGTFDGTYLWDLSNEPAGRYYWAQIEVRDPAGRTHTGNSRSTLIIYRPPDGGPGDLPDAGPPDAPLPDGPGEGGGDGWCAAAPGRGGGAQALPVIVLLLTVAVWRRSLRDRRP